MNSNCWLCLTTIDNELSRTKGKIKKIGNEMKRNANEIRVMFIKFPNLVFIGEIKMRPGDMVARRQMDVLLFLCTFRASFDCNTFWAKLIN